jgi:hypothetical protein
LTAGTSVGELAIIEHRETRAGRFLRRRKGRIALLVAVVEGVLVLAGVIPWWLVFVLAAGGLAAYIGFGRESRREDVRQLTWIAAVSQLAVVLVPAAALIVTVLAAIVLVILAAVALAALLLDRR